MSVGLSPLRTLSALLLLGGAPSASTAAVEAVSVGSGLASVNRYDASSRLIGRIVGLERPVDVTSLPDGSLLLVDEGTNAVLLIDPSGSLAWREQIGSHPLRARPRPLGGILVTSIDEVLATGADRKVEWRLSLPGVRAAVPLANGNVLAATTRADRWLVELNPQGEAIRQVPAGGAKGSGPSAHVWSLDVGPDGEVFASDPSGGEAFLLSADWGERRSIAGTAGARDTRIGALGDLSAALPGSFRVWRRTAEEETSFETGTPPLCASIAPDGTLWVGLAAEEAVRNLGKTAAPSSMVPWWKRGVPLPALTALASFLFAMAIRWPDLRRSASAASPARESAARPIGPVRVGPLIFWGAALSASAGLSWWGIGIIEARGYSLAAWPFALGCAAGAVALDKMNRAAGTTESWSYFFPVRWPAPARRGDGLRTALLAALALAGMGIALWTLRRAPGAEAVAVAGWLAAQIGILAAAFPPVRAPATDRAKATTRALLGALLVGAAFLRFWQIGHYPDYVHHDHVLYGEEILRALGGEWRPFFARGYSVGRPWFLPVLLALRLFGVEYWALRLTGAISGVVLVGATYLLGQELFNRRTGLIAATLVTATHLLLLYSRQPYVLDPTTPFVLAAWAAAVGLGRGSRFHWCAAGVLLGWSLLGYYVSVTYVPIFAGFFAYLACFHGRAFWRARTGFLWFAAGLSAAYLPVLAQALDAAIVERAQTTVVFLATDGSLRSDGALWANQLGRSFGYIFRYYTDYAWGVSAGQPICMRSGACLFGIGVVYLFLRFWTPAAFVLLLWIPCCIFLGSATQPSPPTPYHFLAAVVAIMLASAVALDRALAPVDRFPQGLVRLPFELAACILLGAIAFFDVNAVWQGVRRLPPRDGRIVLRADAVVAAARFVGEHPGYRHYLVRSRQDHSSSAAVFRFFTHGSDLVDLSGSLAEALPVPVEEEARGVSFIFLPSRAAERATLSALYPTAQEEEVLYGQSAVESLWTYRVEADAARRVYEGARGVCLRSEERARPDA